MISRSPSVSVETCYGALAFFLTVIHNIFLLYHVDIFVSVYKIDKSSFWIGETVFLLWNSFNDPLFGWLSDRKYLSTTKSSNPNLPDVVMRRILALQWCGPLFAVSFLAFWIQWTYPALQFVICLCVYDGFLTMIDLHHSALLADLAISAESRTRLNSRSSLFSAMGSVSVFLSYAFWNKQHLRSFRMFCMSLSLLSILGFLIGASILRKAVLKRQKGNDIIVSERSVPEKTIANSKMLKTFIQQIVRHKNFMWFAAMNLIQVFHCHFNSNFFPLFLENLLGNTISPGFGSFLIGISFVAPHLNNLYFLTLCRRFGVYAVIHTLFFVKLLVSVVMFMLGPNHVWMLCLFIASNRVFTEGTCKLLNLVISDLVDEDYVIHGRKEAVSALIFGTSALLSKPGQTFAPLIGTWLLTVQTGHDIFQSGNEIGSLQIDSKTMDAATWENQRQGCFNLLIYIPVTCAVLQILVWTQFTLHGYKLQWIKSMRSGCHSSDV